MSKKYLFLDTNVLLGDSEALYKFGDNDIVIAMPVLEEIDSKKKGVGAVAQAARHVSRQIDELRGKSSKFLEEGVSIPKCGKLKIVLSKREPAFSHGIDKDYTDNILLQTILDFKKNKKRPVILVSNDIALRIKASSLGIDSEPYENIRAEESNIKKNARDYFMEGEVIDQFMNGEILNQDFELNAEINEFLFLKNFENNQSVLVRNTPFGPKPVSDYNHGVFGIKPRNADQKMAFDLILDPEIFLVSLIGKAGSGKSLSALACCLDLVVEKQEFDKLLIIKPNVTVGKGLGFLPGSLNEKLEPLYGSIYDNFEFIFRKRDKRSHDGYEPWDHLKEKHLLEFEALQYIRGRSIPNSIILVDECQQLSKHEMKTILTRAGEDSKIILTGDIDQIDVPYLDSMSNGLSIVTDLFSADVEASKIFGSVYFQKSERSKLAEISARIM